MLTNKYSIPSTTTTTTTSSTTTTTTTLAPCNNPIFEIINGELFKRVNYNNIQFTINQLLGKGLISTNCHSCCPDCEDVYFFGGGGKFVQFVEGEFGFVPGDPGGGGTTPECCTNIEGSEAAIELIEENLPIEFEPCSNSFSTCLSQLEEAVGETYYQQLLNLGIVEYSTIKGNTIICSLLEEIQKSPVYSSTLAFYFFSLLLETGIVVYCFGEFVLVSNVDTYFSLKESL